MNNTTILAVIVALIVGLAGGYVLGVNTSPVASGTHEMPGGSVMSDTMLDMTANLQGKTGDAFDKSFIEEMILHHEGAVAMAELALQEAKHPEIKTMAEAIISAQTSEITTMRGWLQLWFGSGN